MPKVPQRALIVAHGVQLPFNRLIQVTSVYGGEIRQLAILQPTENRFHWIKHRCPRRQWLQGQARVKSLQSFPDGRSLVHVAAVPDHNDPLRKFSEQRFQEVRHLHVVEIAVYQGAVNQPEAVAPRRQPQRHCQGHLLSLFAFLEQLRRMSARSPGAPHQRRHQKPTFIDQNDIGLVASRFFLIRGHSVANQLAIFWGSRSRGTRCGFCGVKPRARSQRTRYCGCRWISHSSLINCASRRHVHSSVVKPNSLGLSCNHRSTIFSWVMESFRGRPRTARALSARQPRSANAFRQRWTLRDPTSRNSATSWTEWPSNNRRTANNRRDSSSAAVPGVLI